MSSRIFSGYLASVASGSFPRTRKVIWRLIYGLLSRFWRDDAWRFMNYGYVPPGPAFPLEPADEPERPFIGLYRQAVDGLPLAGVAVLEVGSGRGGGSRYIARYHGPASVVGVDYSTDTVRRAESLSADTPTLSFRQGDAERLPFPDASFDVVVNIESSHCYADVPAFAREVARVLKPGGWFTFADMRKRDALAGLDAELAVPGLDLVETRDISKGVVAALDAAEARKRVHLDRLRLIRPIAVEFSASRGSILYKALSRGDVIYVARRYRKAG